MSEKVDVEMNLKTTDEAEKQFNRLIGVVQRLGSEFEKVIKKEKELEAQAKLGSMSEEFAKASEDKARAGGFRGAAGLGGKGAGGGMAPGMLGKMGISKGMAGAGTAVVAGLVIMAKGAEKAAKAFSIMNNTTLTQAQQMEEIGSAIIPLYDSIKEFRRNIDGTNARLKVNANFFQMREVISAESHRVGVARSNFRIQEASAAGNVEATKKFQRAKRVQFDETTAQGRLQAEFQKQSESADDAKVIAKREQAAAQAKVAATERESLANQKEIARAQKQAAEAEKAYEKIKEQENSGGSLLGATTMRDKAGMDEAIHNKLQAQEDLARKIARQDQLDNSLHEAKSSLIEKNNSLRQAEVGQIDAQIAKLKTIEQIQRGSAAKLGGMNKAERALNVRALEAFMKHGPGKVSPEVMRRAGLIAPESVADKQAEFGENTPEYKRLQKLGLKEFQPGTMKDTIQKRQALEAVKTEVVIQMNEQAMATEIAKNLTPFVMAMIKNITAGAQNTINKTKTEQQKAANNGH